MKDIPQNIKQEFFGLANRLSPENLFCDGECTRAQAMARQRQIMREWAVLEHRVGRKVSQDEVEDEQISRWRSSMDNKKIASQLLFMAKELVGMPVFEEAPGFREVFRDFLAFCQKISDEYMDKHFPTLGKATVEAMEGGRYIRIVKKEVSSRYAHLFIDKTNGDILKAAGWNAPAKHARGNIFDRASWKVVGPYGAAYLR